MAALLVELREEQRKGQKELKTELQLHFRKSKTASKHSRGDFSPFSVMVVGLDEVLGCHQVPKEEVVTFNKVFSGAFISPCCCLISMTLPCSDSDLDKRMQTTPEEVAQNGQDGVQAITLTMLRDLIDRKKLHNLAIGIEAGFHIDMPILAHGLQDKVALRKKDSAAFELSHAPNDLKCFTLPVPVLGGWEDKGLRNQDEFTVNEQAEALAGFKGFVDANRSHVGACNRFAGLLIGVRAEKVKQGEWKKNGRQWMCQPFLYFRDIKQGTDHYWTCAPAIGTETAARCVSWWLGEAMRRAEVFSKQIELRLQIAQDVDTSTVADTADGEGGAAAGAETDAGDAGTPAGVASRLGQLRVGLADNVLQDKENLCNIAIGYSLHTKAARVTSAVAKQSCVPPLPTEIVIHNFMAGRLAGVYSR
jgi:hypothetical protein